MASCRRGGGRWGCRRCFELASGWSKAETVFWKSAIFLFRKIGYNRKDIGYSDGKTVDGMKYFPIQVLFPVHENGRI